jgi:hypothetical protein
MRFQARIRSLGRRLDAATRRATRYRGMLVIVLWQAPVGPVVGPDGSVSLLFGGGLDQYVTEFGCDGPTQTASQRYRLAAVEFDRDVSRSVRVEGVVGGISWEPTDPLPWLAAKGSSGGFGQFNVRWDSNNWGAGGGLLLLPDMGHYDAGYGDPKSEYTAMPSGYLRAGPAERLHARMDLTPPSALGSQVPGRIGAGWNATRRDRFSGFIGVASLGSSSDLLGSGVTAEATVPVSARASIRVLGHYGEGFDKTVNGLALGGRYSFGARPAETAAVRGVVR